MSIYTNELLQKTANNIKSIRKSKQLKQADMAEFGFNLRRYQDIESGKANLTIKSLELLSKAFGVDISDFFVENVEINNGQNNTSSCNNEVFELYHNIIHSLPYGIIIWKLKQYDDPSSFYLFDYNSSAEKSTKSLANKKGMYLNDVFTSVQEQGIDLLFYDVIKTGKARRNSSLYYQDGSLPLTVYNIWFTKIDDDTLYALFEDITEARFASDIKPKLAQREQS